MLQRPTNNVPKQVHFATPLVTTPHYRIPPWRAAYSKVCNTLLERYPQEQITKDTNHNQHNGLQYGALDSGTTDHFVPTNYHGTNHQDTTNGVTVGCANGSTMQFKATDCLDLGNLPCEACTCHKFEEVHLPLALVPKLCAHGCTVHFGPAAVHVTKNGQVILSGTKDPARNLHMVPLQDTIKSQPRHPNIVTSATAANAYDLTRTTQQLAFLHASAGYPTRTTFLRAICRNFFLG